MCVHGLIQRREFFTLVLSLVIVHRLLAIVHICHCFVCTIYNTCHACTKCKKALTMLYNLYLWANSVQVFCTFMLLFRLLLMVCCTWTLLYTSCFRCGDFVLASTDKLIAYADDHLPTLNARR